MAGEVGLTAKQEIEYSTLFSRKNDPKQKPLTQKMEEDLAWLTEKKENLVLPAGAKSYCEQWYLEKKYNRKKEWYSNKVEKGLRVEPIGIKMLSSFEGVELSKNDEWFDNKFIEGTPDVIFNDTVADIKSSWDIFTFPWFEKELPNKDYYWQLQGYMDIAKINKAFIAYCLIDTPNPIIQLELKKLYYASGGVADEWTPEINEQLAENFKFSDIPEMDRIKKFEVLKNQPDIQRIYERVEMCRKYIDTLKENKEVLA